MPSASRRRAFASTSNAVSVPRRAIPVGEFHAVTLSSGVLLILKAAHSVLRLSANWELDFGFANSINPYICPMIQFACAQRQIRRSF